MLITLKRDVPHIKHSVIQTDNATNYQNPFITLILPVLGLAHDIFVDRLIHTEAQDGKSVLDAHFARGTGKVKSYVQQGNDCTTPQELVTGLIADGGLPNCVVELVQYNRSKMTVFMDQVAPVLRHFSKLVDRVNDVIYHYPENASLSQVGEDFTFQSCSAFIAQVFAYSGVGEGSKIEVDPKSSLCRRSTNNLVAFSNTDTVSVIDPLTSRAHTSVDSEGGEFDEVIEHFDGLNDDFDEATEDIVYELENEDCDEEVIFPGSNGVILTGVTIVTIVQIHLRERRWTDSRRISFLPVTTRRLSPYPEKALSAYVKRSLLDLREAGRLGIIQASDLTDRLVSSCISIPSNSESPTAKGGWAMRPPKGKMYGAKYIKFYAGEILEMFIRGEKNKSEKLGPARMLEKLSHNPKRYNLPSENDVRGEVSRLMQSRKRKQTYDVNNTNENIPPESKRFRMQENYASFLRSLVQQDSSIRPATALAKFREKFPNSSVDASSDQISRKVSALKQRAKKTRGYQSPVKRHQT